MSKHTPGPWVADKVTPRILDGDPYWRVGVVGGTCLYVGCGDENDEADARLIAVAPDMLDVLRRVDASIVGCEANATSRKNWQDDMAAVKEMVRKVLRAAVGAA